MMSNDYITVTEAANILGVSLLTLRQKLKARGIELLRDPLDSRKRLISRSQVEALRTLPADRQLPPGDGDRQPVEQRQPTEPTSRALPAEPPQRQRRTKGTRFWVFDEHSQHYELLTREQAERIKFAIGKAKIFEADSFSEASEQYRKFALAVARGHERW
jgi:excisionase family DNA binding protein